MKKKCLYLLLILCPVMLSSGIPAMHMNQPDAILGKWLTENGKAHVEIYKNNKSYEGKIVWLKEPLDPVSGKPKKDVKNENQNDRSRPILGLVNLRNFSYSGENIWEEGRIYNPEDGKDYKCKMTLKDATTLEVRGFIGISLIGKTQTWKRVK